MKVLFFFSIVIKAQPCLVVETQRQFSPGDRTKGKAGLVAAELSAGDSLHRP